MGVKIGLISDVHASPVPLQTALTLLQQAEVEYILCAGDIAGYGPDLEQTVELLIKHHCETILGNHDVWRLLRAEDEVIGPGVEYLRDLPISIGCTVEEKNIYMVHASPPESLMSGIKLLDETGQLIPAMAEHWTKELDSFPHDVLVVGHTHQVFAERLGDVLVVNPGSTVFNHTCAVLNLPEMTVRVLALGGRKPLLAWNFGMEYAVEKIRKERSSE